VIEDQKASDRVASGNSATGGWLRALQMTTPLASNPTRIFPVVIEELATQFPDKAALVFDREQLTYDQLGHRANRYARWALKQGLVQGDVVCLLMSNRPEYLATWIGLSSVGVIVSLLNTGLPGASLAHCLNTVSPKHIIVAAEFADAIVAAQPYLTDRAKIWVHGSGQPDFPRIDLEIGNLSGEKLDRDERRPLTLHDCALYIYTSGTTGLPKAARVSHHRVMQWSYWFAGLMGTQSDDRMYDCLPLYHSVGGVVATGAVLVSGGSVVLREKFSAHRFWDEIVAWDCTLFQYIGELCRYLVHTPHRPSEIAHRIRLCCGNGLRMDIWQEFKNRFRIPRILEFYAATESNVSLYNLEGVPGSVGRIPPFLAHRSPLALVKVDADTARLIKDEQGLCIRCAVNEVGEAIGKIDDDSESLARRFDGYTDREASEQRIMRDVFKSGDCWFRTGDLMRTGDNGFFYFIDRIGDTFRWKGENVSTTEVAAALMACPGVADAAVYGVQIPGTDGRAGMAAIVIDRSFNLAALPDFLQARLPEYAHPAFLRICERLEATSTFKQIKGNLIRQGYDPSVVMDWLYVKDRKHQGFVRLDQALFDDIQNGTIKV
jgi:fatty-acyl-CoA synthase